MYSERDECGCTRRFTRHFCAAITSSRTLTLSASYSLKGAPRVPGPLAKHLRCARWRTKPCALPCFATLVCVCVCVCVCTNFAPRRKWRPSPLRRRVPYYLKNFRPMRRRPRSADVRNGPTGSSALWQMVVWCRRNRHRLGHFAGRRRACDSRDRVLRRGRVWPFTVIQARQRRLTEALRQRKP
jgi:hypothetical protein